jgi:leader peptidase (prepilin peptidase)/N-methyltransferase
VPLWFSQYPHAHGLLVSVAGLIIAGGLTWIVRVIGFAAMRREAMGFGDVILMAVIGGFLGWQPAVLAFIIAPAVALVLLPVQLFVHRDRYIPYGPYLSVGALIVLAAWRPLWSGFGGWGGAGAIFDLGPILVLLLAVMAVMFFLTLLLVQGLKRLFGLQDHPAEFVVQWTAADQSQFQAGERVDLQAGMWRLPEWPGQASGRGMLQEDRWRRPQNRMSHRHTMLPPGSNGR